MTKIEDIAIQFCEIGYKSCNECMNYQRGFRDCKPLCEAKKVIDEEVKENETC